jgi:hypothetical protein
MPADGSAGEEQLREDQRRGRAVEEEVVPLDRGADGARDDRPHPLRTQNLRRRRSGSHLSIPQSPLPGRSVSAAPTADKSEL